MYHGIPKNGVTRGSKEVHFLYCDTTLAKFATKKASWSSILFFKTSPLRMVWVDLLRTGVEWCSEVVAALLMPMATDLELFNCTD